MTQPKMSSSKLLTASIQITIFLTLITVTSSHRNSSYSQQFEGVACIDDSDCTVLGHKYVCYLYKCINWVSHNQCHHSHPQCPHNHHCHRLTTVFDEHEHICVPKLAQCEKHSDCKRHHKCCKNTCCPKHYFEQWKSFSCVIDEQCVEWNTGQRCCSGGKCCDDMMVSEKAEIYEKNETDVTRDEAEEILDSFFDSDAQNLIIEKELFTESDTHEPDRDERISRHSNNFQQQSHQQVTTLSTSQASPLPLKIMDKSGATVRKANICEVFIKIFLLTLTLHQCS